MTFSNYFAVLLFSIGCFLPAAIAEEQIKEVPPKAGHTLPVPTETGPPGSGHQMPTHSMPGKLMAGSTKVDPPMPGSQMTSPPTPGLQMTSPPTPGSQMTSPPTPGSQMTSPPMPGHPAAPTPPMSAPHMTNIPHVKYGEEHHGTEHREGHREDLHRYAGQDYNHWNEHEQRIWRSGEWRHEKYRGRFGWWWKAGGMMYFYEEPVLGFRLCRHLCDYLFDPPTVKTRSYLTEPCVFPHNL
jgi:hypothetical protein